MLVKNTVNRCYCSFVTTAAKKYPQTMLIFIMDIFCETPTKKPFIEELAPIFIITPAQLGIEPTKIFRS